MDPGTSGVYSNALSDPKAEQITFQGWESDDPDRHLEISHQEISINKKKGRGNHRPTTIAKCDICNAIIKHPSRIKEHYRTHTGEKPFQCDICGKRFTRRSPMVHHYREHLGDLPYECSIGCGKRFVNLSRKNAHELRHLGMERSGPPRPHLKPPRRVVCPPIVDSASRSENLSNSAVANYISPQLADFDDDEEQLHDVKKTEVLFKQATQPSVNVIIKTDNQEIPALLYGSRDESGELKSEKQVEADKRIEDVIETVLSRLLPTEEDTDPMLDVGPLMDPDELTPVAKKRTYVTRRAVTIAQCKICGLMLKHPSKIKAHERTHTGEKPFQCGECGKTFTVATSLRVHIARFHLNKRPFECEWNCGMVFVSESCRREHEKVVHSGFKRYECLINGCSAGFSRRAYLMNHRKNVHGNVFSPIYSHRQVVNEETNSSQLDDNSLMVFNSEENIMLINSTTHQLINGLFPDNNSDDDGK